MNRPMGRRGPESEALSTPTVIGNLALRYTQQLGVIAGGKSRKNELTPELKTELQDTINSFVNWLQTKKRLAADAAKRYSDLKFPRPSPSDWIMRVEDSEVQFNSFIIGESSFEYFRLVVLHECFHLFVQDVPNKSDAKRVKDDFGDGFMKLLDIEADYYAAMYLKEVHHLSLIDLFKLYHLGSTIFGDPRIRFPKVERFIGSVLSISNAYFKYPGSRQTKENDIYLPNISNMPLEESIHVLIARDRHFALGEIHADLHDFLELTKCYAGAGSKGIGVCQYIKSLVDFASKALNTGTPPSIYTEMVQLRGEMRFR
jgi:hypothetical protein